MSVVMKQVTVQTAVTKKVMVISLPHSKVARMETCLAAFHAAEHRLNREKSVVGAIVFLIAATLIYLMWYGMPGNFVLPLCGTVIAGAGGATVWERYSTFIDFALKLLQEAKAALLKEFLVPRGWDGVTEYEIESVADSVQ